jgi:ABC-2 type transport system ATP-binding protein
VDFTDEYTTVEVEGAQVVGRDGSRAAYTFERSAISASELISQISARYRIRDLEVREPDIEETVRRIYEERLLG